MNCPSCGGDCYPITETYTKGKDFSVGKACCGFLLFNWIGILCGMCGNGRQTHSNTYWLCNKCGNKFKV